MSDGIFPSPQFRRIETQTFLKIGFQEKENSFTSTI
jgi:hypothetical protein